MERAIHAGAINAGCGKKFAEVLHVVARGYKHERLALRSDNLAQDVQQSCRLVGALYGKEAEPQVLANLGVHVQAYQHRITQACARKVHQGTR